MDIAASFQAAAIDVLTAKTLRAARESGARSIILCGGVAANRALRTNLKEESKKIGAAFFVPEFKYNLDNAAMIGAAGYFAYLRKKKYPFRANGGMEI
jgi:N6-L-threonylcarbamoyladenine synthase